MYELTENDKIKRENQLSKQLLLSLNQFLELLELRNGYIHAPTYQNIYIFFLFGKWLSVYSKRKLVQSPGRV